MLSPVATWFYCRIDEQPQSGDARFISFGNTAALQVTIIFSERELTSLHAIDRPSVCRLSSVCPVVCNARAPYSGGSNFRQYFYGIGYLGHPMTSA